MENKARLGDIGIGSRNSKIYNWGRTSFSSNLGFVGAINNREAQLGQNLAFGGKLTGDGFARPDWTNASRGSCQDDIALLKLHDGGDMLDQVRNPIKNQIQTRSLLVLWPSVVP